MNPAEAPDNDILELLREKKFHQAFELLLERFKDRVFRLSYSFLRGESQAEDMTQDVFVRIWKGLPGYHGEASLSTWVYTITRNTCFTELKKRANRPTVSLDAPEFEHGLESLPELHTSDREGGLEMDVQELMNQLPERYRQVIVLFYMEQKAYEEVAAMLAIPLGTVKTLLFRAKKELLKIAKRAPIPAAQHAD